MRGWMALFVVSLYLRDWPRWMRSLPRPGRFGRLAIAGGLVLAALVWPVYRATGGSWVWALVYGAALVPVALGAGYAAGWADERWRSR